MLNLENFQVAPGNRRGERIVYARLSDGTLRKIRDPGLIRMVLLRYDVEQDAKLNPKGFRRILAFLKRRWTWFTFPLVLFAMWLTKVLGLA